mmetsp:Transcript_52582/g.118380  ORF Transcript_52582/g.118380 Transcript_52582/m.118380 type:complete len:1132 (-) Transcript_52582:28-3423(-)
MAAAVTEVTRDTFLQFRDGCRVRRIQAEYRRLQQDAKDNGRTEDEEMQSRGYKDFASFARTCPQFDVLCWPQEFAELGSGTVLYFHFLAFLACMLLLFFLIQTPVMAIYASEDWAGYTSWPWIEWQDSFLEDSPCACAGTNNGFALAGADSSTYGIECGAWDLATTTCTSYTDADRPKWCCRSWCFAESNCAAGPNQDGTLYLSNVRANVNGQTLVAAATECAQESSFATCGGPDAEASALTPSEKSYSRYFVYKITPGSYGPDQAEGIIIPVLYLAMVILLILGCVGLYQHFLATNTKIDLQTTQPNDFAVMVTGLPLSATDEALIVKWFKENILRNKKDTEIVKVVIGWDFPMFREKFTKMKELQKKLKETDPTSPEVKTIQLQMVEVKKQLDSAAPGTAAKLASSGTAVVTFRYQTDLRQCLKRWNTRWARWFYSDNEDIGFLWSGNGLWKGQPLPKFPVGDHPVQRISVARAANPGDINWEEMGKPAQERYYLMLQTNGQMAILVLISFIVVWGLQRLQIFMEEEDFSGASVLGVLPALAVGIANIICVQAANRLGVKEFHDTFTSEQLSITLKMTVALTINTSGALFFVNAKPDEWYSNTGLANNVLYILLLTSFIPPLIQLLDPKQCILYFKRRKLTDEKIQEWNAELKGPPPTTAEAKKKRQAVNAEIAAFKRVFEPSDIRPPRRYANALKSFISCTCFMPVLPITPLIGVAALCLQYAVDKYLILRCYKRPARPSSAALAKGSLVLLKSTTPLLLGLASFCFLTPSFQEKDRMLQLFGIVCLIALGVAVTPVSVLRTALGLRLVLRRETFQGTSAESEDYYKAQYGWPKEFKYHKDHFLYKLLPEDKNPEFLTPESAATKAAEVSATYGASAGAAILASSMAAAGAGAVAAASTAGGDEPGAGAPPTESGKSYGAAGSTPPVASGTAAAPTVSGKTYGAGGVAATVYGASTDGGADTPTPVVPEPVPTGSGVSAGASEPPAAPAEADGPPAKSVEGTALLAAAATPTPSPPAADEPDSPSRKGDGKGKSDTDGKGKGKGKAKAGGGTWEYEAGKGFTPFNDDCQDYMERRYQEFKAGSGKARINVQTAGGDGKKIAISIDFERMTSKVENSKTIRKIRRKDSE